MKHISFQQHERAHKKKYIKACLFFFYISHFIPKTHNETFRIFSTSTEKSIHLPARNSFLIITFSCYEKGDFCVPVKKSHFHCLVDGDTRFLRPETITHEWFECQMPRVVVPLSN